MGETYRTLMRELQEYNPELLEKQRVIAITKCDIPDQNQFNAKEIRRALPPGLPIVFISSVAGVGLNNLKNELWKALNER